MLIWMLIEARHEAGQVEGALVFKQSPSSLIPKPQIEFFSDEGSVTLIHLSESKLVFLAPKRPSCKFVTCFL